MKRGFTLIEILVAITIFALVMVAAYQVYERSQKAYVLGEQLSNTQQDIRFAYEQISHDLKTAGYLIYPDANALRPDMPLEGMWSGAVAIRGAFSYGGAEIIALECGSKDGYGNCTGSGNGLFNVVTTQNQDVHIYALKSAVPSTDPRYDAGATLYFKADMLWPRNCTVGSDPSCFTTVELDNVCLTQTSPPYTLYLAQVVDAIPLSSRPSGNITGSNLMWTPIANNVFSIQFTYYNQNGINTTDAITADPTNISNSLSTNFRISHGWPFGSAGGPVFVKNVLFTLTGMTANLDAKYTDPVTTSANFTTQYTPNQQTAYLATKQYRKYSLASSINLINSGVAPHELADTTPPDDPTGLTGVTGYCNGILLTWTPSVAADLAGYYIQFVDSTTWASWGGVTWQYGCDDMPTTCTLTNNVESYANGQAGMFVSNLTNGATYHVRVFSIDTSGNLSRNPTNSVTVTVTPTPVKPNPPNATPPNPYTSNWPGPSNTSTPPDTRTPVASAVVNAFNRQVVNFAPPTQYDTTVTGTCAQCTSPLGLTFSSQDGKWPLLRDPGGFRLYHRRMPTASATNPTMNDNDLVADETTILKSMNSATDLKACPCEYYTYKMKAVTSCTSDTSPCVHVSEFSPILQDAGNNPVAYTAPYPQTPADGTVFPQIVPAAPLAAPSASFISTGTNVYSVTLGFNPILASALKNSDGTFTSPNPNANMNFEVWKYKIWRYDVDPSVNPSAVPTLIPYSGSQTEWDAGANASPAMTQLTSSSVINFTAANQAIAAGTYKWYAISGTYKCTSTTTTYFDGPIGPAAQAPCAITWTAAITSPADPGNGGCPLILANPYTIVAFISGLSGGRTITSAAITISPVGSATGSASGAMTVTNSSTTASAAYAWSTTAFSDGAFTIVVTLTDSTGCKMGLQRCVTLSQSACGVFMFGTPILTGSGTKLNVQITKPSTDGGGNPVQYIINKITFASQSYLTTAVNYYESNPTAGSPTAIPLWSGSATNLNGLSIGRSGSGATYVETSGNLCSSIDLNDNLSDGDWNGNVNWLTITYSKAVTSANGPLNLFETYNLFKCDIVQTQSVPVPRGSMVSVPAVTAIPICGYTWDCGTGKSASLSLDNCDGTGSASCPQGGGNGSCSCTLVTYSAGTPVTCAYIPIYMGP